MIFSSSPKIQKSRISLEIQQLWTMKLVSSSIDLNVTLITGWSLLDYSKIKQHDEKTKHHWLLSATMVFVNTYSWQNYVRVLLLLSTRNTGQIIKRRAEIAVLKGFLPTPQQSQPIKLVNLNLHCTSKHGKTKEKLFSCMLYSIPVQAVSLRRSPYVSPCLDSSKQVAPSLTSNLLHVQDFYSEIPLRPLKKTRLYSSSWAWDIVIDTALCGQLETCVSRIWVGRQQTGFPVTKLFFMYFLWRFQRR